MYFYNASKVGKNFSCQGIAVSMIIIQTVYTEFNISMLTSTVLSDLDDWIDVIRVRLSQEEDWPIVVEPVMTTLNACDYTYYIVDPERKIIAWLEPVDGTILFQECMGALKWNHKRTYSHIHLAICILTGVC